MIDSATNDFVLLNKFIFISGLHRSGTTILADCLKEHPDISSFSNTGFPKDEGQFLQSVFPTAREYGGPGRFGFNKEMHLTENSGLLTQENRIKLVSEWSSHWDISKNVFLEKSPPNLLKSRFLQEIFPNSFFIVIMRHPVAVSYATQKWSKTSIDELLKHWVKCHQIFFSDKKYLNNCIVLKYEDFVQQPDLWLDKIYDFIDIRKIQTSISISSDTNEKYFHKWGIEGLFNKSKGFNIFNTKLKKIENEIIKYGYNLYNC